MFMETTKYTAAFLFYLSLPFPGKQLFSPDWTPAWTDNFLYLSRWDTVKKWENERQKSKPRFTKNYAETRRFLLVGDPASVMAGKLHHKNVLRTDLFIFKVFLFQCFGGINNERKPCATPEWRHLNHLAGETGVRAGKRVLCACRVCQLFDGWVIWVLMYNFLLVNRRCLFISVTHESGPCYMCSKGQVIQIWW